MGATEVAPRTKRKKRNTSKERTERQKRDPLRRASKSPSARARAAGVPCSKCGTKHEKIRSGKIVKLCNGHKRRVTPPKPCGKDPIPGGEVCELHGGQFKQVKNKAAMRVAAKQIEGEVGKLLKECDLPDQHPIDGLLEVVRHSGAMMRLLGSLCATLKLLPDEVKIAFPDKGEPVKYTEDDDTLFGYNHSGDQAQHVLVIMYGIWADRYMRACKMALDANIDERLVRNAESTTNAVFIAVERAIDKAGLTPAQAAAFATTLADELRKLAGPIEERRQVNASKR